MTSKNLIVYDSIKSRAIEFLRTPTPYKTEADLVFPSLYGFAYYYSPNTHRYYTVVNDYSSSGFELEKTTPGSSKMNGDPIGVYTFEKNPDGVTFFDIHPVGNHTNVLNFPNQDTVIYIESQPIDLSNMSIYSLSPPTYGWWYGSDKTIHNIRNIYYKGAPLTVLKSANGSIVQPGLFSQDSTDNLRWDPIAYFIRPTYNDPFYSEFYQAFKDTFSASKDNSGMITAAPPFFAKWEEITAEPPDTVISKPPPVLDPKYYNNFNGGLHDIVAGAKNAALDIVNMIKNLLGAIFPDWLIYLVIAVAAISVVSLLK